MPEKSDVSWSAMVTGYVQNERHGEAMELFLKVKFFTSMNLNGSLLVSALRACSSLGAFEEGRWIHSYIDANQFEYGFELGTTLLDFYAKCGLIQLSKEVFDKMPDRDVTTWSAMIASLALNGYNHSAIQFFLNMLRSKLKPNAITFVGLLVACNHEGLVDEGMTYFKDMVTIYKILPSIEHYGCMVDLLSRAGQTKKVEEMILSMPFEPDGAIWGHFSMDVLSMVTELAERVGRVVLEVEPDHCGIYVGLANAYAVMGRWEGVAKVRREMEERGVATIAGWNYTNICRLRHALTSTCSASIK
ncbi:Pentatricopeptide repeat-containing protein [Platanthera guangdongensis]|uniref:Pentatricopeptide repeat-containing protein n=1 Tax=Platanthera guangdongensis TaxID=2320717 RepID=A0ABR2LES7_9ASPA